MVKKSNHWIKIASIQKSVNKGRKKRQDILPFSFARIERMANYLDIEASPEAIAAAEALAFLAFLAFLAGLADASPEAIADAAGAAIAEAGAAFASPEAIAEAANAEVANMLAIKTANNLLILFPWLV